MRGRTIDIFYNGLDFEKSNFSGAVETDVLINMVILGIFGGNVEQSQPSSRSRGEILQSWWGNSYDIKENSETERLLNNITLSSATPSIVEGSVLKDLSFLKEYAKIGCECEITDANRLRIDVYFLEILADQTKRISLIWDMLSGDLDNGGGVMDLGFDYEFDFKMN